MNKSLIGLLAAMLAAMAIQADGITHRPFIRAQQHKGQTVWTEEFKGQEWQCGEERCFAGLHLHPVRWGTGT